MVSEKPVRIGILTISDRAFRGEYADESGPAVAAWLGAALTCDWEAIPRLVPDEAAAIAGALAELCDAAGCRLVLTTGGTGPAARDVTPEATTSACDRLLPGFGEAMRRTAAPRVPTAILGRQTAGVRGSSLILNLPGSPRAAIESLEAVFPVVPHCLELLGGPRLAVDAERVPLPRLPH